MGTAAVVRLLALCLVAATAAAQTAGAVWESPKFLPPDDLTDLEFAINDQTADGIIISLNEHATPIIALINYAGEEVPTSSEETELEIEYEWSPEKQMYTMKVTASCDYDNGGKKRFEWNVQIGQERASVVVNLQNINDNPPQFINQERSCNVDEYVGDVENFVQEETTCTITVRDADGDADKTTVTAFENGQASTVFEVRKTGEATNGKTEQSYVLFLLEPLDYEEYAVRILSIQADDSANQVQMAYVVNVGDLPDTPPVWNNFLGSMNIDEKQRAEETVTAHDGDISISAAISYKLRVINEAYEDYFAIGETDGKLIINPIDRDTLQQETFEVELTAYETDDDSSSVTQTVTVIVNDVNDHTPEITASSQSTKVDESYSGTFEFGISIEDPDLADNGRFSISLEESTWSPAFLVVPASGYQSTAVTISVRDPASLDYENSEWRKITLKVIAEEVANQSHVSFQEFTIELNDINDEFPVFTEQKFTVTVPENEDVGNHVTTISATDADADDVITYTIVPSTQFQVDEHTGDVTVKRALDYETTPELTLQLIATDLADHRAYAELVVTLIDVNDESPTIEATPAITNVSEEADEGISIAQISASDPDTRANLELSIDWASSFASKLGRKLQEDEEVYYKDSFKFVITEDDERQVIADLTTTGDPKLDWGKLDTIYLVLVVTDTATDEQYVGEKDKSTVTMTITIDDINNNAPVFQEVEELTVREEEDDYPIGTIYADDADGPGNNEVKYSIAGAEEMYDGYVSINSKGEIRTIQAIDCDKKGYDVIRLVVTATDGLNSATKDITIKVIDINDNDPIFGEFERDVSIPERTEDGTEILNIIATDADITAPFNTIRYKMQNTDNNQYYFMIDEETGILSVKLEEGIELRREDKTDFTIQVVARDNYIDNVAGAGGSNSNQTTITVHLLDINDNAPEFKPIDGCFISDVGEITEEKKKGDKLGTVNATDTDEGENSAISYFIVSITDTTTGQEAQLFSVSETSGEVTATDDLLDKWGEYDVLFQAFDHGEPPLNGTVTYTFCVKDVNNHVPEFVYPTDGDVIRLRETQDVGRPLKDWHNVDLPDFVVTDEDDISTGNGLVTLTITDGSDGVFRIETSNDVNKFKLLLNQSLSAVTDTSFELELTATDGGDQPLSASIRVDIRIIYMTPVDPRFPQAQWNTSFHENTTGLSDSVIILEATDPNNNNLPPEDQEPIYYYIVGGDEDLFQLNHVTRELTLSQQLDYEKVKMHTIYILATNTEEKPVEVPSLEKDNILECTVYVIDVNDMPPEFRKDSLTGGFTIDYTIDTPLFTIKAIDPDVDDFVTYEMNSPITASSDSLSKFTNPLRLEESGRVILNFSPKDETLDGYYTFIARAKDQMGDEKGHYADAEVQVYVISNIHRVTFQFQNNQTDVENKQDEVERIFSEVFNYNCSVEDTRTSSDPSSGQPLSDSTDVIAYFIDSTRNLPVERDVITRQFYEQEIYLKLQSNFLYELNLTLKSYQAVGNKDAANMEGILTIILIVVSAVLGTMVIVLFVAFFLRTKTLKRRLEALQELKFGSQNSGLNRVGVAVPNTNKHAVEGSNPMWRTEAVIDDDNVSQGSGDSDMIGIEDNPEFQPSKNKSHFLDGPQPRKLTGILNKEFTFHPDDPDDKLKTESQYLSPESLGEEPQPRRITETLNNNFILQYDTDDNDLNQKPQSVNPLANGNLNNTDNFEGNDNFSFKPTDSVPVTQL